jgi:DoxX-like family
MTTSTTNETHTRKTRALLWTIQGLLALLFLFAGVMKLVAPAAELAQQSPLPPLFIKFIGLAEVAGALGLVLPGLLRIGRGLTSLAAAGLVIIMVGATALTAAAGQIGAVVPGVVGLLAAFVAYKRWPARARGGVSVPAGQAT